MEDLVIREAKPEDEPYLATFNYNNCFETEHRELDKQVLLKGVHQADDRGLHYFVAAIGDKPVGIMGYVIYPDLLNESTFYMVQSVYVVKEHRRKGIFSRLYQKLQEMAEEDPLATSLQLYVEKENIPAQKTYSKLGMSKQKLLLLEQDLTL